MSSGMAFNVVPFRRRSKLPRRLFLAGMLVAAFSAGAAYNALDIDQWVHRQLSQEPASAYRFERINFSICGSFRRYTCVIDGDTVWLRGEKIRLAGIDAPEKHEPQCRYEADLANQATHKLRDLLSDNEWRLARIGKDRYGRTLATFHTLTSTIGDELIAAGLARKWRGRRMPWC